MEPRIRVAVDRLVSRLLPLYFKVQRSQEPTQGTVVSLLVAQKKLKLKALCTWGREKPAITLSSRPSASEPPGGCIFGISCSQARTHTQLAFLLSKEPRSIYYLSAKSTMRGGETDAVL